MSPTYQKGLRPSGRGSGPDQFQLNEFQETLFHELEFHEDEFQLEEFQELEFQEELFQLDEFQLLEFQLELFQLELFQLEEFQLEEFHEEDTVPKGPVVTQAPPGAQTRAGTPWFASPGEPENEVAAESDSEPARAPATGRAECPSSHLTLSGDQSGCSCRRIAAPAATWGAANEVPEIEA
jgi:hypothetical protein